MRATRSALDQRVRRRGTHATGAAPMNRAVGPRLIRVLLASVLVGAFGCATPDVRIPRERATKVGSGEGLVFGSVRITVDSSLPDTSPSLAPGRDSAGATHELVIDCATTLQRILSIPNEIVLPLKIDEELIIVQKLPARSCDFVERASGGLLLPMSSLLGIVEVQSGRTTYFGAAIVLLPAVIAGGGRARVIVADQKPRTVEALRAEYGSLLDDAQFQPMR